MSCHRIPGGFICTGSFSEPTATKECREAMWAEGKSCQKCEFDCYRRGWLKPAVDKDNAKIVRMLSDDPKDVL